MSVLFVHVRVVLSGRWVRLWEAAGFLDGILSLPVPSAPLEPLPLVGSRVGRYICLWILSHCVCKCRCSDHRLQHESMVKLRGELKLRVIIQGLSYNFNVLFKWQVISRYYTCHISEQPSVLMSRITLYSTSVSALCLYCVIGYGWFLVPTAIQT